MQELLDPRINGWLAQFFVWAVGIGFIAFCKIMRDVIKTQRDLQADVKGLMGTIGKDVEMLKREIVRIDSVMVTWETIKRMELSLQAMSNGERESALAKAMRIEIDAREPRVSK